MTHALQRFGWLGVALMLGCSSTTTQTRDEAPSETPQTADAATEAETAGEADSETSSNALVYKDLERMEEMLPRQFAWTVGPTEELDVRWLSGPEAIAAIDANDTIHGLRGKRPDSEVTLEDLLQHPDSRVLYMVARGAPLPDVEQYFIPMPVEGPAELAEFTNRAMPTMLMTPMGWPRFEEPRKEAEENLERWPKLDEASLGALLESGETFVIFQHMTGCGAAPRGRRQLAGLDLPDDFPLYVDDDFEALDTHFDEHRIRLPSSSFLAFHDGEWIDFHPYTSMSLETIEHFFHRIGLMEDGPQAPVVTPALFGEDVNMALALTRTNYWTSLAMQGVDAKGMRIWNGAISGSDFSGADLSGAIFKNVIIARTSFEGATLEDASFENVTLREVVCVDGEVRSGEVEGCLLASE